MCSFSRSEDALTLIWAVKHQGKTSRRSHVVVDEGNRAFNIRKLLREQIAWRREQGADRLPPLAPVTLPGVTLPAHLKAMPQTRKTGMRRAVQGLPPFEDAKKRLFIESDQGADLPRANSVPMRHVAGGGVPVR